MARSTYVYVVEEMLKPVSAFTVKHELIAWVDANPREPGSLRRVWRIRDNYRGRQDPVLIYSMGDWLW